MAPIAHSTNIGQGTVNATHPPHVLALAADEGHIDRHITTGVIIDQGIVFAACGYQTIIFLAVVPVDNVLTRHTLKVRQREHQRLEILHLHISGIALSLIPGL